MERPESLTQDRLEILLSNAIWELYTHLCHEDKAKLADYLGMTEEELAYFDVGGDV